MAKKKKAFYVHVFCNGFVYAENSDKALGTIKNSKVSDLPFVVKDCDIDVSVSREEFMDDFDPEK